MIKTLVILAAGGAIGTIGRFLVHVWLGEASQTGFPWSTFVVNVSGCLLIGIIYGWSEHAVSMSANTRLFLATGICGGFTTFSTFAFENVRLLNAGYTGTVLAYITASLALGIVAVTAGHYLIRQFF